MGVSTCHFCDEWVQVAYHGNQMAFARNWPEIIHIYDLHYNDIVKFKIQAFILKMTIYKAK
jgi:hypothetical protein